MDIGVTMNGYQHLLTTMFIIGILLVLFPSEQYLSQKEQIVLFVSLLIFSSLVTPDIDLKLPSVGHRGPTHNPLTIVVIFIILSVIAFFALEHFKLVEYTKYIYLIAAGAILGWILHSLEDKFMPKHSVLIWVFLIVFGVVAFIIAG